MMGSCFFSSPCLLWSLSAATASQRSRTTGDALTSLNFSIVQRSLLWDFTLLNILNLLMLHGG